MTLLVTLQLMLDAIVLREMHLHEVMKEKRRNLPTTKRQMMTLNLEMTTPMLQLMTKRLWLLKTKIPKTQNRGNTEDVDVDADAVTTAVTTTATTAITTTA